MTDAEKETVRKGPQDSPLIKSKVAGNLQIAAALQCGIEGESSISVKEHADILQSQVAFQNAIIEMVRKQLFNLGVVVSNIADAVIKERLELRALINYIMTFISEHQPVNSKEGSEGTNLLPHQVPAFLPAPYIHKALKPESHNYKYTQCNPEYGRQRERDINARLTEDFNSTTEDRLLKESINATRESITADTEQIVRNEIREEVLREEIFARKEQLKQEIKKEYREETRLEIETKVRDEFLKKLELGCQKERTCPEFNFGLVPNLVLNSSII